MLKSIRSLVDAPYNKEHFGFALRRFMHWKLIRIFRMRNIRYRLWDNRMIILNYDSLQSMWIMYNYILDWEEFNLIAYYAAAGDQLMDVGANVGAYSIWMSKYISQGGKLHSFEPDQDNYGKLMENIAANKIEGVIVANNQALSDIDGVLRFTVGLDRLNHISLSEGDGVITVPCGRVDTYLREHSISRIAYMKVDVEGFEYTVLKGAHEALAKKCIDILQLEINEAVENAGVTVDQVLRLLKDYGYALSRYDVEANRLVAVEYQKERENYFAVYDLERANQKLQSKR